MIAAFTYLIRTTARNAVASRVRQLRNPRYAIAILLGLGYFWLVLFNRSARSSRQASPLVSETFATLIPVAILIYVAYMWIFGADRSALAFSEAEVSMLFPAPVSRRGLVVYKLVRAQVAVLTTSVLWLVLFHSSSSSLLRVASSWVFLTTLSLHRLGVALLQASRAEHGTAGRRRRWLPIALFTVGLAIVVGDLLLARGRLMSASASADMAHALITELGTAPLSWVLYPFRVAIAPMFAHPLSAWLGAMGPALVLLALHVVWVLRSDAAFEEAAAEASAAQAKRLQAMRSRVGTATVAQTKGKRRTIALAPTGAPEVALIWKNVLWLLRTGQVRGLFGLPTIALVCCLAFAGRSTTAEVLVVVMCSVMSVMVVIFGPVTQRNDLRGELRNLPILKTMPLRGRDIMFAEVASSAMPVALMQFYLVVVAILALSFIGKDTLPLAVRIGILAGAPVFLLGLNFVNFAIHNGLALLFPAWVQLGQASGGAGIEVMGQLMLTSFITLFLLALMLIVPAVAAAAVYFGMGFPPLFAAAGAEVVSGIACGLEAYALLSALGGSLDRLEPMQIS